MKRRKRSSKSKKTGLPETRRLRVLADNLWSAAVRADWADRCAVCRSIEVIQAHHLLPRQFTTMRYELRNGIALCRYHHQLDPHISPHQNGGGFVVWLRDHYPESHRWYMEQVENGIPRFDGTKNPAYYCDILRDLRTYVEEDVFVDVIGVRLRGVLDTPS